jgi:SAM-dependent methyltransferase
MHKNLAKWPIHAVPGQCGVCRGQSLSKIANMNRLNPFLQEIPIRFYICKSCACVFHTETTFRTGDYYDNPVRMASLSRSFDFILYYLRDKQCGLTALDVGCSNGNLMLLLKNQGFQTFGIEVSIEAREKASERGLQIYDSIESLGKHRFDLLLFSHVIEHVDAPAAFMNRYMPFLRDNGSIFVEVPSIELLSQAYESTFNNLSPNHIYHFSEDGIAKLATFLGCSVVALQHHHYLNYPSLMCLYRKKQPYAYQILRFQKNVQNEQTIVDSIANRLQRHLKNYCHLVIWGCSDECYQILKRLTAETLTKTILVDSSPSKIGKKVLSLQISSPQKLRDLNDMLLFVAPTSPKVVSSIEHSMKEFVNRKHIHVLFNKREK